MLPPEIADLFPPDVWANLEQEIIALNDEEKRVFKAILVEKLQTGAMPSLKYVKPTMRLINFVQESWSQLEPSEFIGSWHIDAICEHLEAVIAGQIRNLLINIPPRCSKSLIVSVLWPAWVWTFRPSLKWLFSSYDSDLSTEHSWKCRTLIQSDWYVERWGHVFRIVDDQNQKTRYDNTKLGYRKSTAVGAAATGFGGDIVVCDDPNNIKTIDSETKRREVTNWWDLVMSTRLNNAKTGSRVVIQQRCHEADLTGHILAKDPEQWTKLILPMEYESQYHCTTSIGWSDPRTTEGELLCPARFDEAAVKQQKKNLGTYGYVGQMQQHPAPPGGGMFKREWFKIVDLPPRKPQAIVRFWDVAGTEEAPGKDPDWTVGTRMSVQDGIYYVEHVVRDRWTAGGVDAVIRQTAASDGKMVPVREEQEGGSAGKAVVASRLKGLAGWDYEARPASGSKPTRAKPLAVQAEGGNVVLVRGAWNNDWLDELSIFDRGKHDDQVDSASGAFNELVGLVNTITVF